MKLIVTVTAEDWRMALSSLTAPIESAHTTPVTVALNRQALWAEWKLHAHGIRHVAIGVEHVRTAFRYSFLLDKAAREIEDAFRDGRVMPYERQRKVALTD